MSTVVKEPEQREFTPAPEGLHQAVCCDVHPIWTEERPSQWGGGLRDCVRLVWQIDQLGPDGQPFVISKKYTASLHEKASLRHDLESWRGRHFTPEELKGFDLENVLGANCQIQIVHTKKPDGRTFANVLSIVPIAKGQPKMAVSKDYVRKKDRADAVNAEPMDDETPPF